MTLLATIALYYFNAGVWWWVAFGICAALDVAAAILRDYLRTDASRISTHGVLNDKEKP